MGDPEGVDVPDGEDENEMLEGKFWMGQGANGSLMMSCDALCNPTRRTDMDMPGPHHKVAIGTAPPYASSLNDDALGKTFSAGETVM